MKSLTRVNRYFMLIISFLTIFMLLTYRLEMHGDPVGTEWEGVCVALIWMPTR